MGGSDYTITYTGWRLKDSGSGNQYNFLTGLTYTLGDFQIAPNFLWQKPIVGPVPSDAQGPAKPRNIVDDPFAVRSNRETTAGELLFAYDPTPATWMWAWDNDVITSYSIHYTKLYDVKILGYDQNRGEELGKWVDVMFKNKASSKFFDGTAIHWYGSTFDWFPESLQYAHQKAPHKYLIQTVV